MEWIKLSEHFPEETLSRCLATDILHDDRRYMVCKIDPKMKGVTCVDGNMRTFLPVINSICPDICAENHGYWMPIPDENNENWIIFDEEKYDHNKREELLLKLHNGNYYTGYIEFSFWSPTYNMFRRGALSQIEKYLPLSKLPSIHE